MITRNMYHRVQDLINQGLTNGEIADCLRCKRTTAEQYRHALKKYGSPEAARAARCAARNQYNRALGMRSATEIKRQSEARNQPIIAAFDSGLSFSAVARKFGVSRNVVAGIVHRRPEGRV